MNSSHIKNIKLFRVKSKEYFFEIYLRRTFGVLWVYLPVPLCTWEWGVQAPNSISCKRDWKKNTWRIYMIYIYNIYTMSHIYEWYTYIHIYNMNMCKYKYIMYSFSAVWGNGGYVLDLLLRKSVACWMVVYSSKRLRARDSNEEFGISSQRRGIAWVKGLSEGLPKSFHKCQGKERVSVKHMAIFLS